MGCRLMVGQEILVLFIMVRIRAPQPKIKTPMWRFYFWFVATVRSPQRTLPVRKQVGEISDSAVEPSRFPRGRPAPRELSAPQPNKKHPVGVFFIWYSHGLCKSVSHLHRKTLLMFCNHFGKSQISQNGNGGTPPFPRVRPNQKLKRPCGVFIFGSWPQFAICNQRCRFENK